MESRFKISFPAIRGIQAGREYYVAMVPLHLIADIFRFDDDTELPAELRAQRTLNKARIPQIARYITENKNNYVFSALTASINGNVKFEEVGNEADNTKFGMLSSTMSSKFIINDGQHRREAIKRAILEEPDLKDETIAVVFFIDKGLERSQQMFTDLNRYSIRPNKSLGLLYDHRNDLAGISKMLCIDSGPFSSLVEMEKSSVSPRSKKLFTLSAIHTACRALLDQSEIKNFDEASQMCKEYWHEIAKHFPEWRMVRDNELSAGEVRSDKIHTHGIVLQALGNVGCQLLTENPKDWKKKLAPLKEIDWSRNNRTQWEGRALTGGTVSKTSNHVTLTTNLIKKRLGLTLSPDEKRVEDAYTRGQSGRKNS